MLLQRIDGLPGELAVQGVVVVELSAIADLRVVIVGYLDRHLRWSCVYMCVL